MGEFSGLQLRVLESDPPLVTQLEKRAYRVGRGASGHKSHRPGHLFFSDPTVSAEHAELRWSERDNAFALRHLSITNFTVVAGVKLGRGEARGLRLGDFIQLGSLHLILERSGTPTPTWTPLASVSDLNTPWGETVRRLRELHPRRRPPQVDAEALAVFTRQFSAMIDAGIPISRALGFFSEGLAGGDLSLVIEGIAEKVNSGARLSHSLRSYPQVFSDVYVALVETGEESGQLHISLQRLADLMEKQLRMHKRIIATITYPLILLVVSVLCVSLFIFLILPMIEPMFREMKIDLPLPTRILLASRQVLLPLGAILLAAVSGIWILLPFVTDFLSRHTGLRSRLARAPLDWPVVGPVVRKIAVARILYSMSTMLESGMTLVHAITRSATVSGNIWIRERICLSKAAIMDGQTVAAAFESSKVFPAAAVQLITVGEETSSLATIMKYVAEMFDEEADRSLTDMANMLEPLLMGGLGIIVGFIVIGAMMPTLELINHL